MVCGMLHCLAWIHNRGAPLRPYIHYYNRRYALTCTASGVAVVSGMCWRFCGAVMCSNVAQAAQYSRMQPPHNSSKNTANSRKSVCKALCAVLQRWRYNCIDKTKRSVSACIGLYFSRAKQKPCTLNRCKAKENPASVGGVALRCSLVRYKMFVLKYILFDKFGSSFRIKIYLLGYIRLLILTQSE